MHIATLSIEILTPFARMQALVVKPLHDGTCGSSQISNQLVEASTSHSSQASANARRCSCMAIHIR